MQSYNSRSGVCTCYEVEGELQLATSVNEKADTTFTVDCEYCETGSLSGGVMSLRPAEKTSEIHLSDKPCILSDKDFNELFFNVSKFEPMVLVKKTSDIVIFIVSHGNGTFYLEFLVSLFSLL